MIKFLGCYALGVTLMHFLIIHPFFMKRTGSFVNTCQAIWFFMFANYNNFHENNRLKFPLIMEYALLNTGISFIVSEHHVRSFLLTKHNNPNNWTYYFWSGIHNADWSWLWCLLRSCEIALMQQSRYISWRSWVRTECAELNSFRCAVSSENNCILNPCFSVHKP